jgi:hypothetical protein
MSADLIDQDGTVLISVGEPETGEQWVPLIEGGQGREAHELLDVRACLAAGLWIVGLGITIGALSLVIDPPHAGAISLVVMR